MNKLLFSRINKNSLLLLVLLLILTLCLLYIDDITSYFNRTIKNQDTFNNISGYDVNKGKYSNIEGFVSIDISTDTNSNTSMNKTVERNYKVSVEPKTKSIKVEFQEVADSEIDSGIKKLGYLIILAKYNNRLEKIGHVDAKISNEGIDIENYILENIELFADEPNKDQLRSLMRDVYSTTALSVLTSLNIFTSLNNTGKIKTENVSKPLKAYLNLLEIIYDAKFYKRALDVNVSAIYNTGIVDLYNDLQPVTNLVNFNKTRTTPTEFGANIVIEDTKYDLIQENSLDADLILELNKDATVAPEILNFIDKYIEKYKNLTMSIGDEKIGEGICSRDGICSYTFENLEDKDSNGEFYYYKLGFGLIYNKGVNSYSEEVSQIYSYKYGPGNDAMYFKLDNTLEEQLRLLKRLAEIEKIGIMTSDTKITQPMVNDDGQQDMEAYMKMLRPHLGNYPSEFTLREQDVRDLSLADYLNKSVNAGTVNIGVNVNDTPVFDDTTTTVAQVID